jgi:hypothetical protein
VEHEPPSEVTQLLHCMAWGNRNALDALLPLGLQGITPSRHFQLRNERPKHTLLRAAPVDEAYFPLVGMTSWS